MDAARDAREDVDYALAEAKFLAALEEAKKLGHTEYFVAATNINLSNFYMGRCYFEIGGPANVNLAMERFADAAVLNDATYSEPSRTMVEEIYSLNTGGDLSLLDERVLAPARARMR